MKKFETIYRGLAMMLCLVMVLSCFTGCATWDNFIAGLKDEEVLQEEKKETVRIGVFEPMRGTEK
jgi:hypothetical protein